MLINAAAMMPMSTGVDAERFHVNALLIHQTQSLRTHYLISLRWPVPHHFHSFRNHTMGMNIDGLNPPSTPRNLAAAWGCHLRPEQTAARKRDGTQKRAAAVDDVDSGESISECRITIRE
jgi:hypothetical protein